MGTSNRCTHVQLDKMTEAAINDLPLDQIKTLLDDLEAMKALFECRKKKLENTIDRKSVV